MAEDAIVAMAVASARILFGDERESETREKTESGWMSSVYLVHASFPLQNMGDIIHPYLFEFLSCGLERHLRR